MKLFNVINKLEDGIRRGMVCRVKLGNPPVAKEDEDPEEEEGTWVNLEDLSAEERALVEELSDETSDSSESGSDSGSEEKDLDTPLRLIDLGAAAAAGGIIKTKKKDPAQLQRKPRPFGTVYDRSGEMWYKRPSKAEKGFSEVRVPPDAKEGKPWKEKAGKKILKLRYKNGKVQLFVSKKYKQVTEGTKKFPKGAAKFVKPGEKKPSKKGEKKPGKKVKGKKVAGKKVKGPRKRRPRHLRGDFWWSSAVRGPNKGKISLWTSRTNGAVTQANVKERRQYQKLALGGKLNAGNRTHPEFIANPNDPHRKRAGKVEIVKHKGFDSLTKESQVALKELWEKHTGKKFNPKDDLVEALIGYKYMIRKRHGKRTPDQVMRDFVDGIDSSQFETHEQFLTRKKYLQEMWNGKHGGRDAFEAMMRAIFFEEDEEITLSTPSGAGEIFKNFDNSLASLFKGSDEDSSATEEDSESDASEEGTSDEDEEDEDEGEDEELDVNDPILGENYRDESGNESHTHEQIMEDLRRAGYKG